MSFWSRGRGRKVSGSPSPAEPSETRLAVVEFWTADRRITVGMDLSAERLTDLINREESLRVVPLDHQPEDPSQPLEMRTDQQWLYLPVGETLLILPPPQATDPQRRLHRPRQPVEIVVGRFRVSGMAHVPPGAQAAGFLFRQNTRFAPVTRASIQDTALDGFEQRAEVVLINLRMVETIRDVGVGEPDAPAGNDAMAPVA